MTIKIIYEPTYVSSGWFDVTVKTPGWFDDDLTDVAAASIPGLSPGNLPISPLQMPRSWAASYNLNLIGQDTLPIRQRDWPVPIAPWRSPLLSTWIDPVKLNLIGQDATAPGRQSTDVPQSIPGTSWIRTWALSLSPGIVPVAFPAGAISIALSPAGYPLTSWVRTWTANYNLNLIGQDVLPVLQRDWSPPIAPVRMPQGWTQVSPFWAVKPFAQTDWPLPIAPFRVPQSWIAPSPFWAVKPFLQTDWPLPTPPFRASQSWSISYNPNLIGQDVLPVLQKDWPVPIAPWRSPLLSTWIDPVKLNLIGQDATAPGRQSFDLARSVPGTSWIRTWTWYALPIVPANALPLNQYDWPTPGVPRPGVQLRTWEGSINLNLIGQDAMAPGQIYDRLARGSPPSVPSWTQWYPLSLIGQDALPVRQRDWPLPIVRPFFQQAPVSFLVSGVVNQPFAQYDWPLSAARPSFRAEPIANVLPLGVTTRPFAQYDWPIPVQSRYPEALQTVAIGTGLPPIGQITIPPGRSSYELTGRPPHPASLRTYVLPLGVPTFFASVPFRQTEWPLPKPPLYALQLRTWVDPVKLNLLGKDTRFFIHDRPLPRRQPEPDHSFAYSRFPGLIPIRLEVCAHTEVTAYEASIRVSSMTSTTDINGAAPTTTDIETRTSITGINAAITSKTKFVSC